MQLCESLLAHLLLFLVGGQQQGFVLVSGKRSQSVLGQERKAGGMRTGECVAKLI